MPKIGTIFGTQNEHQKSFLSEPFGTPNEHQNGRQHWAGAAFPNRLEWPPKWTQNCAILSQMLQTRVSFHLKGVTAISCQRPPIAKRWRQRVLCVSIYWLHCQPARIGALCHRQWPDGTEHERSPLDNQPIANSAVTPSGTPLLKLFLVLKTRTKRLANLPPNPNPKRHYAQHWDQEDATSSAATVNHFTT